MNPPNTRIFIRNLPQNVTEQDLNALFSKCGKIDEIIIKNNFAFIQYNTFQSAQNAIRNFNDYNFHGAKIVVEQAKTRNEKMAEKLREKCFKCGEYGHFAKDCKGSNSQASNNTNNNNNNYFKNANMNMNNDIMELDDDNLGFNGRKRRFKRCRKSPKRSFNESISDVEE